MNSIMQKLAEIDEDVDNELNERKELEEQKKTEKENAIKMQESERKEQMKKAKIEKIQSIVRSTEPGLDEPKMWKITFEHSEGGGYGFGNHVSAGKASSRIITTKREILVAQETGEIKSYTDAGRLAYGCRCTEIISVEEDTEELTEEEKIKLEGMKKKIEAIECYDGEELLQDGLFYSEEDRYDMLEISMTFKEALLVSYNQNPKTFKTFKQIEEEQETTRRMESVSKPSSKITIASIKKAIQKALKKEER